MKDCWDVEMALAEASNLVVVIPACDRDCQMAMKSLDWMRELDGKLDFDCLVSQDAGMNKILARQMVEKAGAVFRSVRHLIYPRPITVGWPHAANWAFQCTAWEMNDQIKRPWFWCEADCVPLSAGWLTHWAAEYTRAGKPVMGAVVQGRGHCNGTAVYPANFATISARAMQATNVAWDWEMRPDTVDITHDASKLLCHVWGIEHGKTSPYNGDAASFPSQTHVDRWVCKDALLFHRSKDGTLIDRLREQRSGVVKPAQRPLAGGGNRMVAA